MAYELGEIKQIRKNLGLTQSELAEHAGVSQSLIAKVEAGLLDPTYSNAQKIFDALDNIGKKKQVKAEEVMSKTVVALDPEDDIRDAIKKMKKHEISQIPVIDNNKAVGFVSEAILLDSIIERKGEKIKDIMQDAPPIVSKDTDANLIAHLLKFNPLVLIAEKGKIKGVITKSDVLRKMYKS